MANSAVLYLRRMKYEYIEVIISINFISIHIIRSNHIGVRYYRNGMGDDPEDSSNSWHTVSAEVCMDCMWKEG